MMTNQSRPSSRYYGVSENPFQANNNGNVFSVGPQAVAGSRSRASGGFGAPIQQPGGSRTRGGGGVNQQDSPVPTGGPQSISPHTTPQDITNALNGTPAAVPTPQPAPTSAQTAENPGQWAGTSFDPTRSIQYSYPTGGANSMPQGSEVVNGSAMYTGSNGPLDTSRFTPGTNQANVWYKQYLGEDPGKVSYLQFADQLGRNALASAGGSWTNNDSLATQQSYLNSPAGQQWVAYLRGQR